MKFFITKNETHKESRKQPFSCNLMALALCLFCLSATFGQTAMQTQPDERVIRFHSDITIDTTGRIEVTEHIRVYAAGNEIKRGIVRELPLTREMKDGKRMKVDYKIIEVRSNAPNPK
jgi:hypothetical protein